MLKPALVDGENGYRYYTTSQLSALHEIVALRQMGFSVAETLSIVDGHNVAKILSQRRAELKRELDDISEQTLRPRAPRTLRAFLHLILLEAL